MIVKQPDRLRMVMDSVELICPTDLPGALAALWNQIQSNNPRLSSPFFSVDFTQVAAQVRNDAEIAVMFSAGQPCGFFPFHRIRTRQAIPIGGALNDYHGFILPEHVTVDAKWLLKQCRLTRWRFHAAPLSQNSLQNYFFLTDEPTWWVDLSASASDYLVQLNAASTLFKRQSQKSRRAIRDFGNPKFVLDDRDPQSLDWVIAQKRRQYHETDCTDFFAATWSRELVRKLFDRANCSCRGVVSTLYAGEDRIAAHLGLLGNGMLHYWYPCYDRRFSRYSPGIELFFRIVRDSELLGINGIDFGYGREPFKAKLATHRSSVANGEVNLNRFRQFANCKTAQAAAWLKSSPLREPVKKVLRIFSPSIGKPKLD